MPPKLHESESDEDWTLICPQSPLGIITTYGTYEKAEALRDDLITQGLAPNGCTITPVK